MDQAPKKPHPGEPAVGRELKIRNTEIRRDLVERVRREIAEGSYDDAAKWEIALDRLADSLLTD